MNTGISQAPSAVTWFWITNERKYYRCLHRPTLCRPNFVVISVPAWMTPVGQRSDKSLKSQASLWLPAKISHTSHAPLNWCASQFSLFSHARTAVPEQESVKVSHSSQVGRTEPRLTISQDENSSVGYFHRLLHQLHPRRQTHVAHNSWCYRHPLGEKKCIILSIA